MSGSSKPGGARGGGFFGFCFFGSGGGAILMGGTYITQCNRQSNAMRTASSAKMTARCFDDVGGGLAIALFDFAGRISDGRGLLLGVGGFCFDGDGWLLRRRAGDCDARARGGIVAIRPRHGVLLITLNYFIQKGEILRGAFLLPYHPVLARRAGGRRNFRSRVRRTLSKRPGHLLPIQWRHQLPQTHLLLPPPPPFHSIYLPNLAIAATSFRDRIR